MVANAGLTNTGQRKDGRKPAATDGAEQSPGADTAGQTDAGFADAGFAGVHPHDQGAAAMPGPSTLAQDWITVWQSELSAMAADPEIRETWQTLASMWAGTMSAMLQGLPRSPMPDFVESRSTGARSTGPRSGGTRSAAPGPNGHDRPAGHDRTARPAGTADAPRPPPAAAAPDPRDAEVERLARHIAVLERRLANLEHGGDPPIAAKRRPQRPLKRQ